MLIKLYDNNPDKEKIKQIVSCLEKGGVIVYPTDSVYSLGCSMMKMRGIEKVAKLKGIKPNKAKFSLICKDLSDISKYTKPINTSIFRLMKASLPGPFTFILEANTDVPKIFNTKKREIGVRVPDNNIIQTIIEALGHPLIGTSVHDDDEILDYTTDPEAIHENLKNEVDMVIDGGFSNNVPTTVIDCTSGEPEIIRQGLGNIDL